MVFLSICTALYDYAPQGDNELELHEGEIVYILEKSSEDDWWKAKKRAPSEDEEEPEGLIPNNYVEEVSSSMLATMLNQVYGLPSLVPVLRGCSSVADSCRA